MRVCVKDVTALRAAGGEWHHLRATKNEYCAVNAAHNSGLSHHLYTY